MNRQIEINIEQLVLHGFNPADRRQIGEALELALAQAFQHNNSNMLHESADILHADGGSFSMNNNSKPAHVGNAIANSVYKSLANTK